jgi:hypothetical protein
MIEYVLVVATSKQVVQEFTSKYGDGKVFRIGNGSR